MNKKQVANTLKEMLGRWLDAIDDRVLRANVERELVVAGGAITSLLQGDTPNDLDIYIQNPKVLKDLAEYYTKQLGLDIIFITSENRVVPLVNVGHKSVVPERALSQIKAAIKKKDDTSKAYRIAFLTTNAITLTGGIQIILRYTGKPADIIKSFDFVHVTNYFTFNDGVVLNEEALESIITKNLKYQGSDYPVASLFRIRKFLYRGFRVSAGELFKISYDISKLNLDDPDIMTDQVIGVDVIYFNEAISKLAEKKTFDRSYIYEVVNQIFND